MSAIVTEMDREAAYALEFDGIRLHQGHLNVIAKALAAERVRVEAPLLAKLTSAQVLLDDAQTDHARIAELEAERDRLRRAYDQLVVLFEEASTP